MPANVLMSRPARTTARRAGFGLSGPFMLVAAALLGAGPTAAQNPPKPAAADARPEAAPDAPGMTLDLTVSTAPGQTAVAPGDLRRTWIEGGRPHARFVTDAPVTPVFGVASARYERQAV